MSDAKLNKKKERKCVRYQRWPELSDTSGSVNWQLGKVRCWFMGLSVLAPLPEKDDVCMEGSGPELGEAAGMGDVCRGCVTTRGSKPSLECKG